MAVTPSSDTKATNGSVAGWLTPDEFHIVEAVCDTFFPSLEPPAGSSDAMKAYYQRRASDLNVAQLVAETLAQENGEAQAEFHQLLGLFNSPVTGLLLAGSAKPFIAPAEQQREKYLLAM